ncbi:MAG: heavy metal translocating P-type ATPase, partial [Lutibacter sp.]
MEAKTCYHCGLDCGKDAVNFNDKCFCCNGCKTVYEILNANELNCYYDFNNAPGTIPAEIKGKYDYLDTKDIESKLIEFNDGEIAVVNFYIPSIHCSSCIWVLENLFKLNKHIVTSTVNFPKKTIRITYRYQQTTLKEIVELLTSIAYEPYISLEDTNNKQQENKQLLYQLVIAAFVFGNVMMLSFPEYFEVDEFWLNKYKYVFRWLMLTMSIPVVFYSAQDYFISAFKGLKHKILNIDVPVAIGVSVLFIRSVIEVVLNIGSGFFDSLTGLVFFLLLGKFFQQKTYNFLSFERDYKSYFPIAVTKIDKGREEAISVKDVKEGDRLLIRNEELIPVDGILINGNALIDYSFVTGESLPVTKNSGEKIFAGGKQTSGAIEIDVINTLAQSYLTQLWSNDAFTKQESKNIKTVTDAISRYFTTVIISIAIIAGIYWYFVNPKMAFNIVTAVLIVACPCALALSAPFAFGNMLRIFGYRKFYLKNANVLEKLASINTIVFDKTGTITHANKNRISYEGKVLNSEQLAVIKKVIRASNHPLSRQLYDFIEENPSKDELQSYEEILGKGIESSTSKFKIKLGSAKFLEISNPNIETAIYVSINNVFYGKFVFSNEYRKEITKVFENLSTQYNLIILSGDNEGEKNNMLKFLPRKTKYFFNKKPEEKLEIIKNIQSKNNKVLMFGDGLNDAGALAQSNVGIAISENIN